MIFEYPKICIGIIGGQSSSQLLYTLCDQIHLKIPRFYAIISAEKHTVVPVTRQQEPHKRGCISKNISKKILEILLEIDMPYGVRDFEVRTKREPKTLVNTGFSASFIVRYRHLKSLKIRMVIVP